MDSSNNSGPFEFVVPPWSVELVAVCFLQGRMCGITNRDFLFWTWVIQVLFCRHCTNDFNDFFVFLSFQISLRPRNFFFLHFIGLVGTENST